jgi:hypothetical protein
MAEEVIEVSGASFSLVKPLIGYRHDIIKQLQKYPFESNVFLMLRFREANKELSDFIIETLQSNGLNGVRADQADWNITSNVYNPIACIYCCKYGIALFDEAEPNQAYNPNVIYELGMMHCLRRECLILRNDSLPPVPFDLIKDLSFPYKGDLAVRANVKKWLQRIAPRAIQGAAPASEGESRLEVAARSAVQGNENDVVSTPDAVEASDLTWRITSKTKKGWKVAWQIKLTNHGASNAALVVHILFMDRNGFALEDSTRQISSLPPGETIVHEATASLSADLGHRIHHAFATVSLVGE